jgi:uncharacterized membrane-anchored protein YitT (DUF2179 family)
MRKKKERTPLNKEATLERRRNIRKEVGRVLLIVLGATISGVAQSFFLLQAKLAPGGLYGVAMILNDRFMINIGLAFALMNLPFFVWALKVLGLKYILRTGLAIAITSIMVDVGMSVLYPLVTKYVTMPNPNDLILYSIFGGAVLGIGVGLVFRNGASTGGTDLISQLIYYSTGFEYGKLVMIFDATIIISVAVNFQNVNLAMYSIVTLIIYGQVLNVVSSGMTSTRMAMIITDAYENVRAAVLARMRRGVTIIDAKGGYQLEERKVLMVAVPQSEISMIKEIVTEVDPKAFVMVSELSEVWGKGFERKKPA